jgi:hypothetical protein
MRSSFVWRYILTLQRMGNGVLVDNLIYTYTGNQLTSLFERVRRTIPEDILDGKVEKYNK